MKSDFMLAFNQVCSDRGLPSEVVLEALQTALESAYRRNAGIDANQNVVAKVDIETGKARVFIEKQVVEDVADPVQEISLAEARARRFKTEVGDAVMIEIESTPRNFGRIAAQNAKQIMAMFEGQVYRLGPLTQVGREAVAGTYLARTYTLLGDPATQMAVPTRYVYLPVVLKSY